MTGRLAEHTLLGIMGRQALRIRAYVSDPEVKADVVVHD